MKIYTISHKPLTECLCPPLVPLYVGGLHVAGELSDDTAINIADKNPAFCELTAQYWVWKNVFPWIADDEPIGFCHYRRILSFGADVNSAADVNAIDYDTALAPLVAGAVDVILPEPVFFRSSSDPFKNYLRFGRPFPRRGPLSLYRQFRWKHCTADMDVFIDLLPTAHRGPFRAYLNGNQLAPYNVYIAKKPVLEAYFALLFPTLFALEDVLGAQRLRRRGQDFVARFGRKAAAQVRYQRRIFGFLAERFASYYFVCCCRPAFVTIRQIDLSTDGGQ